MKILYTKKKNFDLKLDSFLSLRKKKIGSNTVSVTKIIKDVKKNGDKALIKYEKKFNKNSIIVPSSKEIFAWSFNKNLSFMKMIFIDFLKY